MRSHLISVCLKTNLIAIVAPLRVLVYDRVERILELLEETTRKLGYEGFRAKYLVNKLKPDLILIS